MRINDTLTSVNNKLIGSTSFLTMGATACFSFHPFVSASVGILAGIGLSISLAERLKMNKKHYTQFESGFLASFYRHAFTKKLQDYIDNSSSNLEKKYKVIFTSYLLRTQRIQPQFVIQNIFDRSFRWADKFDIKNSRQELVNVFPSMDTPLNFLEFTHQDFQNSHKMETIKKVYNDFEDRGWLGTKISNMEFPRGNFIFLLEIQDYKLTPADLKIIEKKTQEIISTPTEHRFMQMKPNHEEEQILFKIIDANKNDEKAFEILSKFYIERHCNDGLCSFKELVSYLKLDKILPEKNFVLKKNKI